MYINKKKYETYHITKNFINTEFACKKCLEKGILNFSISYQLVYLLQLIRDALCLECSKSIRIIIHSGFRCKKHNFEVGGHPNSLHLKGEAIDFSSPDLSLTDLYKYLEKLNFLSKFKGLGIYINKNFIHVDIAERYSRWVGIHIDNKKEYIYFS